MATGNNHRPIRLIIIDSDKNARSYVKEHLGDNGVRVIGEANDTKSGQRPCEKPCRWSQPPSETSAAPAMELPIRDVGPSQRNERTEP